MVRTYRLPLVAVAVAALSIGVAAQGWRGQGRMAGKVTDEAGKPIEGATIKLFLPTGDGGTELKTDKKGEWAIGGVAGGLWQIDVIKQGYETRRLSMDVAELEPKPAMVIVIKKAAPDPNEVIAGEMKKAAALLGEQKFGDARAIYTDLLTKYPQAFQIHLSMARAYHLEGTHDKEIEEIKLYLEKDPNNVEVKLLAGSEMIAKGNAEEGKQLLASIDESKITEPTIYLNVGINLLNQNKPKDAMMFFDKTVTKFSTYPDGYYYRGIAELQIGSALRPDNQTEGDKFFQAGKADLTKFVEMAPNAPEAAMAKKMLEQLK